MSVPSLFYRFNYCEFLDPAISIEEAPGQDVLQQYVISTHDLGMIATREENSIPPNADADVSCLSFFFIFRQAAFQKM